MVQNPDLEGLVKRLKQSKNEQLKSFLVVGYSIGEGTLVNDVIQISPLIMAFKRTFLHAEINWLK